MGNCELQLFMAPTDVDTPRYISEAIGDQTRAVRVKSWRQRGWARRRSRSGAGGVRLIRPEQIRMLGLDAAIALVRDQNPVWVEKVRYYEDRVLKALYERQSCLGHQQELAELAEAPSTGGDRETREVPSNERVAPVNPRSAPLQEAVRDALDFSARGGIGESEGKAGGPQASYRYSPATAKVDRAGDGIAVQTRAPNALPASSSQLATTAGVSGETGTKSCALASRR